LIGAEEEKIILEMETALPCPYVICISVSHVGNALMEESDGN